MIARFLRVLMSERTFSGRSTASFYQEIYLLLFLLVAVFNSPSVQAQKGPINSGYVPSAESKLGAPNLFGADTGSLPPNIDLSSRMPPVGDQRAQSSCVAWAVAYGARGYYLGLQGNNLSQVAALPSPAFVYNQLTGDPRNCQNGTQIEDALDIVKSQGVATLGDFPYDFRSCKAQPNENIKSIARRNVISQWRQVRHDAGSIKRTLYEGNPVIFGMQIEKRFQTLAPEQIYIDRGSINPESGHAMVIVGYDDKRSAFKVFNSWGKVWANQGFGWVDYKTMLLRSPNFYTMSVDQDDSPKPQPQPQPQPPPPIALPEPADIKNIISQLAILSVGVDCGSVKGAVDKWGVVQLEGFIGKQNELDKMIRSISKIKGVRNIESRVRITPWPLCEAYLSIENLPADGRNKITTRVVDHPDNVLSAGDPLSIEVTLPKTAGYIYVSYLQSNGEAVKFYWGKPYTPSQVLSLGGVGYKIKAPLGKEMLMVLASDKRLFQREDEGSIKGDKRYLADLRKALNELTATDRAKVSYSVTELLTQ